MDSWRKTLNSLKFHVLSGLSDCLLLSVRLPDCGDKVRKTASHILFSYPFFQLVLSQLLICLSGCLSVRSYFSGRRFFGK